MVTFDEFRAMALALPEAVQQPTWEIETLRVRTKIFAMGSPDGTGVSVKASPEDQSELLAAAPEVFSYPRTSGGTAGSVSGSTWSTRRSCASCSPRPGAAPLPSAWSGSSTRRRTGDAERTPPVHVIHPTV